MNPEDDDKYSGNKQDASVLLFRQVVEEEAVSMASRMSVRNDGNDGVRPQTLGDMQILESNSTLTETPSPSPSTTRNSGTYSIQPASSYVSSASSTTGVPSPFSSHPSQTKEVLQPKQLQYPPSPKPQMTTIENSSPRNSKTVRKDSDDAILNIQPVHPFFNQHPGWLAHYDSDGSDGR